MNHVFIYATPSSNDKDAVPQAVAAIRATGFGPYQRKDVLATFSRDGEKKETVIQELRSSIAPTQPFVVVSYNQEITRALLRKDGEDVFPGRAWVDLAHMTWPLVVGGQVKDRSIVSLINHFSVDSSDKDVTDICSSIMQIYGILMRRYQTSLKAEAIAREVGGETLEGLRKILNF